MKSAFSKSLRLIAFLIAIIFTFETILQASPLPASINTAPAPLASSKIPVPPFLSLSPVELPQELGKVEDVFPAAGNSKSPFIYLIQDAHDSLDAQENIRQILKTLIEKEKVSLICFEGGSTEFNNSFYNFTGNPKSNKQVWDALFAKGLIGGLERAALENNSGSRFLGIEDEKIYFKNIRKIQKIFSGEEKSREILEQIDRINSELAGRLLIGDVKKLRDLKRTFEAKRLNLMQYAKELVRSREVNQNEWPQLSRFLKLQEIELSLTKNQEARKKELDQIKKQSEKSPINFIWDSARHSQVKGRLRWYFERMTDELSGKNVSLENFTHLKDWIAFHVLQDEISSSELFEEISRYEISLFDSLNLSDKQKYFLNLEEDCAQVRNLIELELTREDWLSIKSRKLDIKEVAIKVIGFYEETFGKKPKVSVPGALHLIRLFGIAKDNYAIVEQRDQILSKRILERIESAKSGKVAVLTGGFHTDELAAFLKEKNIGFAVISPVIHDINRRLNYRERITSAVRVSRHGGGEADQTALAVAGSLESADAKPFKDSLKIEAQKVMSGLAGSSLGASSNARDISMRAKELSSTGQDRKAVNLLEGALAQTVNQQDGILWYQLAKSHRILKQFPEALTAIRKAKQLKPNDDRILMLMAEILMGLEDDESLEEALAVIEEAIAMYPAIQSLTVKIQILTKLARTQEAIELAGKVKKNWPADLKIYGILSRLYLDVDRPEDAIKTVREGLKINPNDVKGHAIEADLWRNRELDEEDISKRIYYLEMAYRAIMNAVMLAPQHPSYLKVKREIEKDLAYLRKSRAKSISKDDALGASLGAERAVVQEGDSPNIKYLRSVTKFSPGKAAVPPGSFYDMLVTMAGPQALAMLLYQVFQAATGFSEKEKQYEALNNRVWQFLSAADGQVLLNALNVFSGKESGHADVRLQLTDIGEILTTLALPTSERDLITFSGMQILQSMVFVTLKSGEKIQFFVQIRFTQETAKPADEAVIREIPNPLLTSDEGILDGEKRKFISAPFVTPEGAMFRYGITRESTVGFLHVAGYSEADYKRAEEHSQLVRSAQAVLFDELFWKPLESNSDAKALILGVGHGRELIRPDENQNVTDIPESIASRISVTDMMEGPLNELKKRFPKITTIKSDWQKLHVPDESVDLVLGLNAISFVPKRELPGVVRELDRITKPGKDGKKKMIFAVDIPPAQLRVLTEVEDNENPMMLSQKLDAVAFLPRWKEIIQQAFLSQGYQVSFQIKNASAVSSQNEAHRKMDGRSGRRLNTFSFAYDRGIEANYDRSLKPGEVKEEYKVLVIEAVKASSLGLKVVKTGEGLGDLDESGKRPFKIVGFVASGGQGDVFLAEDVRNPGNIKTVILKRINAAGETPSELGDMQSAQADSMVRRALESLKKEAERLERLNHPNIVKIFDFYDGKTDKFIVMEPVDGDRLDYWLKADGRSVSLRQVVEKLIPIADALEHSHERGIVHRDVKPQNIIVRSKPDGGADFVLTDFGLSEEIEDAQKLLQSRSLMSVDRSTGSGGTPQFMSPEQVRGNDRRAFHATTDVWSFGVTLYWLAAGSFPFPVDNPQDLKNAILHGNSLAPSLAAAKNGRPEIPQDLEKIILKMLEKNPKDRPWKMSQVKSELEAINWTKPASPSEARPLPVIKETEVVPSAIPQETSANVALIKAPESLITKRFLAMAVITAAAWIAVVISGGPIFIFAALASIAAITLETVKLTKRATQMDIDAEDDTKEQKLLELIQEYEVGIDSLFPRDLKKLNALIKEVSQSDAFDPVLAERALQINDRVLSSHQQYEELVKVYDEWFSEERPQSKRDYVQRRLREAQILEEHLKETEAALLSLKYAEKHIKEEKNNEDFDDLIAKIKIAEARLFIQEAHTQEINVERHNRAILAVDRATAALKTKVYRVQQFEPRRERLRANIEMLESGYTRGVNSDYLNEDLEYLFSAPGIPQPDGELLYLRGRARMLRSEPDFENAIIDFESALHKSQSRYPLLYDIQIAEAEAYYELAIKKKDPDNNKEWAERKYKKVIESAQAGESNTSLTVRVLESRARSRAKAGKNDEAVKDFMNAAVNRMAMEENPNRDEDVINALLRSLENSDSRIVDAASTALAKLAGKVINLELAVQALIKELNGSAQSGAVIALSRIGEPAIQPCLEILEKKPQTPEAVYAGEVLGKMGAKAVFPLIEVIRKKQDKKILAREIIALGDAIVSSKGEIGLDTAIKILKNQGGNMQAITALGKIAGMLKTNPEKKLSQLDQIREGLLELSSFKSSEGVEALRALEHFPDHRVLHELLEAAILVNHDSWNASRNDAAKTALTHIIENGDEVVIQAFESELDAPRPHWSGFETVARPYRELVRKKKAALKKSEAEDPSEKAVPKAATESESRRLEALKMAGHIINVAERRVQEASGDPDPVELAAEIREAFHAPELLQPAKTSQELSPVPAQTNIKAERAPPAEPRPDLNAVDAESKKPAQTSPKRFNLAALAEIQKSLQADPKISIQEIWDKLSSKVRSEINYDSFEKTVQEEREKLPAPIESIEPETTRQPDGQSEQGPEKVADASSLGIVGDEEEWMFDSEGWKPFSASNQAPDFEKSMDELDAMDERASNLMEDEKWFDAYKIYLEMKKIREFWGMQIPAILILETGIAQKNLRLLDQAEANLSEAIEEIKLWDDTIEEDKEFCLLQSMLQRGDLYTQMGRYEDAVRDFSYILALIRLPDSGKTVIYEQRAFAYLRLSKWKEARRDFAMVVNQDDKDGDDTPLAIYLGLAAALNQLGRGREEGQILREAVKFYPDQFAPDFYQALRLVHKRRFAEAHRKIKRALPKISNRERIYMHLLKGYAFAAKKEYHRALREFQEIVTLDPIHVLAGKNIIQIQNWKKSWGSADPQFEPLSIASPVWFSYFAVDAGMEDEDSYEDTGEVDPVLLLKEIEDLDHRIFEIEKTLSEFTENRPRALVLLQADTLFEINSVEKKNTGKNSPRQLLGALLAYREVRDFDLSVGKKTTSSFVEGRIEKIEKIMSERDYNGVANYSLEQSDDFDGALIERIEAVEDPERRLEQINLAFKEHGELPSLVLQKAIALLEKFERIKNPDKKNIRLLAQSEEIFRDVLRLESDNGFAQKGIARIAEIKAKLFKGGDELGQGAVAQSLGKNLGTEDQEFVRKFFVTRADLVADFLVSEHHLRIEPEKLRAVIYFRILASEKERKTLDEVAVQFNNTKEAIQQIEWKLIEKMILFVKFEELKQLAGKRKQKQILARPVTDLSLGTRALNALQRITGPEKIMTIGELIQMSPSQLLAQNNFRETSLEEIESRLRKIELNLSRDLTEQEVLDNIFKELELLVGKGRRRFQKLLASPVSKLGLPGRTIEVLEEVGRRKFEKEGITIKDLLELKRSDILTVNGAGEKTVGMIEGRLNQLGLKLQAEPEKEPKKVPTITEFIRMIAEGRKDEVLMRPIVDLVLGGKTGKVVERLSRIRYGDDRMTVSQFLAILDHNPEIIGMVRQGMPSVIEDLRTGKMRLLRDALDRVNTPPNGASASSLGEGEDEEDNDLRLIEMEGDLELYMRSKNYSKMIEQINEIEAYLSKKGFEMQPVLYFNRGIAYQNTGNSELSIQPFTQAIELYKSLTRDEEMEDELWESYRQRGVARMDLKQWDDAIADFDEALGISKKDPDILELRGLAYFMKSEWIKVIADLSEVVQAGEAPLRVYLALAYAYDAAYMAHDRNRIEGKMAKKFPDSSKVHFVKALIRFEKKLSKAPLKYVNEAIEKQGKKESAAVYLLKGYICLNLENWEEAEAAFKKAMELDPLNPESRYQLAGILYRDPKIDWEIASEHLNEANFLAGTNLNETSLTRLFQDKKRRVKKAVEFGRKYILEEEELLKINSSVIDKFAEVLNLSDKQKIIEKEMNASGVTVRLLLSRAEILVKRFEASRKLDGIGSYYFLTDAVEDYQTILRLEPDNVIVQDRLNKVSQQLEAFKNKKTEGGSASASSLGKREMADAAPMAGVLDHGQREALELGVNPQIVRPNLYLEPSGDYAMEDRGVWWQVNHQAGNKRTRHAIDLMVFYNLENIPDKDPKSNKYLRQYFTGYMLDSSFLQRWYARHQVLHDVFLASLSPDQRNEFLELVRKKKAELGSVYSSEDVMFNFQLNLFEGQNDIDAKIRRLENVSEIFAYLAEFYLFPEEGTKKEKMNAQHAEFFYPFFEKIKLKVPTAVPALPELVASGASLGLANFKVQYGASRESVEAMIRITGFVGNLLRIHFPAAYAEMSAEFDPSKADKESFSHSVTTVVTKDYFTANGQVLIESLLPKDEIFVLVKSDRDHELLKLLQKSALAKGVRVVSVKKASLNSELRDKKNIFSLEFLTRDAMTVPLLRKEMFRFKWDDSAIVDSQKSEVLAKIRKFFLATSPKDRKSLLEREGITETGGFWFLDRNFLALIEKLANSIQAEKSLQTAA